MEAPSNILYLEFSNPENWQYSTTDMLNINKIVMLIVDIIQWMMYNNV